MKRKALKELMRQAVGNLLINTEINAKALKEKVDPRCSAASPTAWRSRPY